MKKEKGITLIALVITIIVLLILAGVALKTITGYESIPYQAEKAVDEYKNSNVEQAEIDEYGKLLEEHLYTAIERLQKKYIFYYYSDIQSAIADLNNDTLGEGENSEQANATFASYIDENDVSWIVPLKDMNFNEKLSIATDINLNLAGNTLSFNNENAIEVTAGKVNIDGTFSGSQIIVSNDGQKTTVIQVSNGECTINGGIYKTNSKGVGTDADPNVSMNVGNAGVLTLNNVSVISNDSAGGTLIGVMVNEGASAVVSNSNIEVMSPNGIYNDGIRNKGNMTIVNTDVVAYSNYTANAAGNNYATNSRGISNSGTMTLKNCYVYGSHSGIRSPGILYIDGGTYEGYGHGGIYFAGANTTSYVKNATIAQCEMKNGYDDGRAGTNQAGFYVGGASNVSVYMDNCELYGKYYPLVLRNSGGETNNCVYISNSNINEDRERYIRSENTSNKIYIGVGNNFTKSNAVYKEGAAEENAVDYGAQFPEF